MSIAHSFEPVFSVYLPSGNPKLNYNLTLIVHVRDMLGAWTESNLMTIKVNVFFLFKKQFLIQRCRICRKNEKFPQALKLFRKITPAKKTKN